MIDLNTIMNLQYRKLLTAKNDLWLEIGDAWDEPGNLDISLTAAMSLFLIDLDSMSYPEIGEEEREFLGYMIQLFESYPEDEDIGVTLTLSQRQALSEISGNYRLDDAWHRIVALRFASFVNYNYPLMLVGKDVLKEIL